MRVTRSRHPGLVQTRVAHFRGGRALPKPPPFPPPPTTPRNVTLTPGAGPGTARRHPRSWPARTCTGPGRWRRPQSPGGRGWQCRCREGEHGPGIRSLTGYSSDNVRVARSEGRECWALNPTPKHVRRRQPRRDTQLGHGAPTYTRAWWGPSRQCRTTSTHRFSPPLALHLATHPQHITSSPRNTSVGDFVLLPWPPHDAASRDSLGDEVALEVALRRRRHDRGQPLDAVRQNCGIRQVVVLLGVAHRPDRVGISRRRHGGASRRGAGEALGMLELVPKFPGSKLKSGFTSFAACAQDLTGSWMGC